MTQDINFSLAFHILISKLVRMNNNSTSKPVKFNLRHGIQCANEVRLCQVVIANRDEPITLSSVHACKVLENYLEQPWTSCEQNARGGWGTDLYEWKCPTTGSIFAEYVNYHNTRAVFNIYSSR